MLVGYHQNQPFGSEIRYLAKSRYNTIIHCIIQIRMYVHRVTQRKGAVQKLKVTLKLTHNDKSLVFAFCLRKRRDSFSNLYWYCAGTMVPGMKERKSINHASGIEWKHTSTRGRWTEAHSTKTNLRRRSCIQNCKLCKLASTLKDDIERLLSSTRTDTAAKISLLIRLWSADEYTSQRWRFSLSLHSTLAFHMDNLIQLG